MEAARPSSLISLCEMYNYLQLSDLLVLDVRPAAAFDELHIKTAIGIDVASFTSLTSEGTYHAVYTVKLVQKSKRSFMSGSDRDGKRVSMFLG